MNQPPASSAAASSNPATAPAPVLDANGLPVGYPFKPEWEVTPRQARDALRHAAGDARGPAPLLLDVRRPDEFALARIDGAVLIPLDQLEKRAEELDDHPLGKARTIFVHCHRGMRSLKATAALRALGFSDVRSIAGGIDLWSIDIDARVPRY